MSSINFGYMLLEYQFQLRYRKHWKCCCVFTKCVNKNPLACLPQGIVYLFIYLFHFPLYSQEFQSRVLLLDTRLLLHHCKLNFHCFSLSLTLKVSISHHCLNLAAFLKIRFSTKIKLSAINEKTTLWCQTVRVHHCMWWSSNVQPHIVTHHSAFKWHMNISLDHCF